MTSAPKHLRSVRRLQTDGMEYPMLRFMGLLERQSFRRLFLRIFKPKGSNHTATLRHAVVTPEIRPLSPFPASGIFFSVNYSKNICLPFKSRLRVCFDFLSKAQHLSTPLLSEVQRKMQPNVPLGDLFFAPKSCRFYVPKMSLKNANGCSVCAWLLTSGGFQPAMRLTPHRRPRASRSGADQAHTL